MGFMLNANSTGGTTGKKMSSSPKNISGILSSSKVESGVENWWKLVEAVGNCWKLLEVIGNGKLLEVVKWLVVENVGS